MGRLKSFAQYTNRKAASPTAEDLKKDRSMYNRFAPHYETFLLWMTDNGWKYSRQPDQYQFYTETILEKIFPRSEASEDLLDQIVDDMGEVQDRFEGEGFQTHFLISFNGKPQQKHNPEQNRSNLYEFNGIGDRTSSGFFQSKEDAARYNSYSAKIYDSTTHFVARIQFMLI